VSENTFIHNKNLRLRRSRDPLGYWINGAFHEGFPDDQELTQGQRLRIAGWARVLTPEQFTEEQEQLLANFSLAEKDS